MRPLRSFVRLPACSFVAIVGDKFEEKSKTKLAMFSIRMKTLSLFTSSILASLVLSISTTEARFISDGNKLIIYFLLD